MPLAPAVVAEFTAAALHCLRTTVGVNAVIRGAGPASCEPTIGVTIDLRGGINGPVTWRFPQDVALELVRRLTDDPDPDPSTAADGAAELANILTGRASEVLESHGFRCEISTPRVHIGALPAGITVQMTTSDGPIEVVLSLSDADAAPAA